MMKEIKSLFSRAVGKEPTTRQIDIANDPVNFAKNYINTDNERNLLWLIDKITQES